MRRRLYIEERVSPTARWSLRLVLFSIPVLVLAVLLFRLGVLEFTSALTVFAAGLLLAGSGGLTGAVAFCIVWDSGWIGIGRAVAALVLAIALLAAPAVVIARGMMLPDFTDVTTDPEDPPRFHALLLARPREANSTVYSGAATAAEQKRGYPGIKPVDLAASPDEAFNAVLALVRKRGWRILDATSPLGTRRDGRIEAVVISPLTGYRNDVVIRIRPTAKGARVDMRSASRYGSRDFGSNAAYVGDLIGDLTAERRRR